MQSRSLAFVAIIAIAFSLIALARTTPPTSGVMTVTSETPARSAGAGRACVEPEEDQLLALINAYRGQHDLAPLVMSRAFHAASEHHAASMSTHGYFSHDLQPEGISWWQNAEAFGAESGYRGENIAWGFDATGTFEQWKNSPPHNAIMLDPNYTVVGVARYTGLAPVSNSRWQSQVWAAGFGDTLDAEAQACDVATVTPTTPSPTPTPSPSPTPTPTTPPSPALTPPATSVPPSPPATTTPQPVTPTPTPVVDDIERGEGDRWCVRIANAETGSRWCATPNAKGVIKGEAIIDGVPVTITIDPESQKVKVSLARDARASRGVFRSE